MSCFADNLEHRILPKSLGRPVLSKEQYGVYMDGIRGYFEYYEMQVREVLECEEGSIVFHVRPSLPSLLLTALTIIFGFCAVHAGNGGRKVGVGKRLRERVHDHHAFR